VPVWVPSESRDTFAASPGGEAGDPVELKWRIARKNVHPRRKRKRNVQASHSVPGFDLVRS
jgi:hypothetical protein